MTNKKKQVAEEVQEQKQNVGAVYDKDTITNILNVLVPPENITITDVFGDEHNVPSTTSARAQIKIMRLLETIKDVQVDDSITLEVASVNDIVSVLGKLIMNETVFDVICKSAQLAHPKLVKKLVEKAKDEDVDFEEDMPLADLLPIEEVISIIVPLFLKIARRTGQAINKLAEVV